MARIISGVTTQKIYFVALSTADFMTRLTGLSSFTVYRSRNGGAAAAFTTPTVTEVDATNMPGVYCLTMDEDTTLEDGEDEHEICLHITAGGMQPVTRVVDLTRVLTTAQATTLTSIPANAAGATIIALANNDVPDDPDPETYAAAMKAALENLPAIKAITDQFSGKVPDGILPDVDDVNTATGGVTQLTADRAAKEVTFYVGSEGNKSRNIITLNAWSAGTRTLAYDLSELLDQANTTINTVTSVTVVKGATSITTSDLRKHQDQRIVLWDTAAITSANAGTYTVTVTVVTFDTNTIVLTGTLEVE